VKKEIHKTTVFQGACKGIKRRPGLCDRKRSHEGRKVGGFYGPSMVWGRLAKNTPKKLGHLRGLGSAGGTATGAPGGWLGGPKKLPNSAANLKGAGTQSNVALLHGTPW